MTFRVLVILAFTMSAAAASSGQVVDVGASVINPQLTGRATFEFYCAACHGRDGTGNGPVASSLKTRPADLTTLAARNEGRFSQERVREVITHGQTDAAAHGSSEMPIWGPIFGAVESPEQAVETRIENLVKYIESMQAK